LLTCSGVIEQGQLVPLFGVLEPRQLREPEPRSASRAVVYYVFDLLHLDGRDLTDRPLIGGMPTPPQFRKGPIDRGVTNIRNVNSAHWRAWMKPEYRCLVPATSFCEPTDAPDPSTGRKRWTWFALAEDRPLFAFAGIWCTWRGLRGTQKNPVDDEHTLYGFLTTAPNDVVRPVHSKAMPVILTEPAEWDTWLEADADTALKMQRPLPAERLRVVALDQREGDGVVDAPQGPQSQLAL
jgi:putative SOS response-associated peptidase YedK